LKTAVPILEERGLDSPVSETFLLAPYFVILNPKDGELEVSLYKNVSSSDSDIAQVLLAYGVKRIVCPKCSNRVKIAYQELGIEVVSRDFETLSQVIDELFAG